MSSFYHVVTSGPFCQKKQFAGLGDGVMVYVDNQPHVIQQGIPTPIISTVYIHDLTLSELSSRQTLDTLNDNDLIKVTSTLIEIAKQIQILHELRGNN